MKRWHSIVMYGAVVGITLEAIGMGVTHRTRPATLVEALAIIAVDAVLTIVQMHRSRADVRTAMGTGFIFVIAAASTLLVLGV